MADSIKKVKDKFQCKLQAKLGDDKGKARFQCLRFKIKMWKEIHKTKCKLKLTIFSQKTDLYKIQDLKCMETHDNCLNNQYKGIWLPFLLFSPSIFFKFHWGWPSEPYLQLNHFWVSSGEMNLFNGVLIRKAGDQHEKVICQKGKLKETPRK